MRNQQWPSVLIAMLIAAAIVIAPGLILAGFVSNSVNPLDPNVSVDAWRSAYISALGWSAALAALFSGIWLLMAHGGRGLDTKAGAWYALWGVAVFVAALLAWLIPPTVKEGPAIPMSVCALLVFAAYWTATLFLTPDQYRYTPLLGRVLWGRHA
jgi:hypothetical protein